MQYNAILMLPGNIIHRNKHGFHHQAVILENGYIYENTPKRGEHVSRLDDFIRKAGESLRVSTYPLPRRLAHLERVEQQLQTPRKWSVLNNCQDTVSRITEGQARSHQRTEFLWATFFAFIGVYALKKSA